MTNEEAIADLKEALKEVDTFRKIYSKQRKVSVEYEKRYASLSLAIKALEQTDILDKIKVEIDLKQYNFMDNKDYDEGIRFGLMLAYQIIDKYKAESEEEG